VLAPLRSRGYPTKHTVGKAIRQFVDAREWDRKCGLCSSLSALLDANPLRPHQNPLKNYCILQRAYTNLIVKVLLYFSYMYFFLLE
jgi:hypothetical protein